MSAVTTKDAWVRAKDAVASFLETLPESGRLQIGPYTYNSDTWSIFSLSRVENEERVLYSLCSFYVSAYRHPDMFHEISIRTSERGLWQLSEDRISYEDKDQAYPRFEYQWDRSGRLRFLRVNINYDAFANYYGDSSTHYMIGDVNKLGVLPELLEGQEELLGHKIPWTIDFDAKAEEIVRLSEIEQFAAAVASQF
jgi:hypothetical protein